MRTIGRLTTLLLGVGVAAAVAVGMRSIPDVKRYLEMRRM